MKKDDNINWDIDSMIENAKSLQHVAKSLEKDSSKALRSDPWLFPGLFLAGPILSSLAIEIALKAWWCREQNKPPKQWHNLLALFDLLKPETQEALEARMRKASPHSVWAEALKMQELDPISQEVLGAKMHPLRDVLGAHSTANMQWRFLYEERRGAWFDTAEIDRAITVIIAAYYEKYSELA